MFCQRIKIQHGSVKYVSTFLSVGLIGHDHFSSHLNLVVTLKIDGELSFLMPENVVITRNL
jgi:hypothetical protein